MGAAKQGRIIKLQLLFLFFLPLAIWCLVFSVDSKICISVYYIHSSIYYFMRVPWTARRSNQSIVKKISPGISLEGMMLKLKLQYFGHLMWSVDSLEKTLMLGGIGGRRRRGRQRMRWLDGITDSMDVESEWTPGVGDGQGGLACCDSWGRKESDMTERLIWSDLIWA